MGESDPLTTQRIADLVMANRAIREPDYEKAQDETVRFTDPDKGIQWGADVIPALLGLFSLKQDPGNPDGWVGVARHWRGGTLRLAFECFSADEQEPILIVTAIDGRAGDTSIVDDDGDAIDLPAAPTQEDWENRTKQYQAARRKDESDGTAAVRAYIAALPGWKRDRAAQFDEIIDAELSDVRRAVKWHQPFYGVEDRGWFACFSAYTTHVKLSFVAGSYLTPEPPTGTSPDRQALDLQEADALDEEQVASWIRQAAEDPGMNW